MQPLASLLVWSGISVLGASAFGVLALSRGETVNAAWLLTAAVCTYAVGYRFYSKFLASRVFGLDDRRATPAERFNNGRDYVPTDKWVLYGHHFAAIAGAGPLVGPVLAAQFGFLPGTLWLVIGVVVGGAGPDFVILFCSLRRDGKSLGHMGKVEGVGFRRRGAGGWVPVLPPQPPQVFQKDPHALGPGHLSLGPPPATPHAGAHAVRHAGGGPGVRGEAVSVRVHHDRVRGDL